MLDDLLVGARGARVRCTECGTVFRVQPATGGSLAELGAALPDEPWRVQRGGVELQFASVSDLSRAILAGQVHENDVLSRGMLPARRLGEVLELLSFFSRARRPDPDERVQTLPGLSDPSQRAAIERARAEVQQLQADARAARGAVRLVSEPPPATPEPARSAPSPERASAWPESVRRHSAWPDPVVRESTAPEAQWPAAPAPFTPAPVASAPFVQAEQPSYEEPSPEPPRPELVLGASDELPALSGVPEAAVSPPFLPDFDPAPSSDREESAPHRPHDLASPVPPAPAWLSAAPERARPDADERIAAPREDDARKARLRTGVLSLLAAAALVLVAGLGARSLRAQKDPERPQAMATAPVAATGAEPAPSVASTAPEAVAASAPVASAGALVPVAPAEYEAPALVGGAVAPAGSAASPESHRGDPQNLPTVDPRRMVADGARALRRGELGKAEEAFQRAINKNPYDSEALSGLGDLARIRGQHDKAREIYAQVLSVNPSYLPALLALADLSWGSGDRGEARRGYEYIVGHYPESAYPARVKQRAGEESAP